MSNLKDKSLEHVNVQQAGKNELKKVLKENSLNILLKAAYYAKKKNKKHITKKEIKKALKK
jgi:histone H3/H4